MDIMKAAKDISSYIIGQRRYFHQHPELSLEETETTKAIVKELKAMGIECETFDWATGTIGTIHGAKPGKTVMLRADIDALPVEEHTGLDFSSQNKGIMHACGHDGHTAMLLGAAKLLTEMKNELNGTVKLLFQSGEESLNGAKPYVEHNILHNVDAIYGQHLWGTLDVPYINMQAGERMASADNFKITVTGASAHGSAPHMGHDALVAAANMVMNIQSLVSRVNNPLNSLVVTIGTMNGGKRFNIIPDNIVMEGTVRTFSKEMRAVMEEKIRKIILDCADVYGCKAELEYNYCLEVVDNSDPDINRIAKNAAIKLFGESALKDVPKGMGSEDFSLFMKKIPGFYGFIGSRNIDKGICYTNHNDKFTVDEDVLSKGTAMYVQFAKDFLDETASKKGGNN